MNVEGKHIHLGKQIKMDSKQRPMGLLSASRLKVMFWNCRGYPWNMGLGLNDVAQGIDIIFLVETWEYEAKHIPKIDGTS